MAAQSSGLAQAVSHTAERLARMFEVSAERAESAARFAYRAAREVAVRAGEVGSKFHSALRRAVVFGRAFATNHLARLRAQRMARRQNRLQGVAWSSRRFEATDPSVEIDRPTGVTIIAMLTFGAAGILVLGAVAFFFVAVMAITGGDGVDPVSAAIAGMGVAGGFSLLVLAGVAGCLAFGVLELQEWARIVSIGSIAAGIVCTVASVFAIVGYSGAMPPVIICQVVAIGMGGWMLEYLGRPSVRQTFRAAAAETEIAGAA
ncbi:MAG: hypothetical protein ACRD59_15460 [Candidatus Acidiferrales bacterium]